MNMYTMNRKTYMGGKMFFESLYGPRYRFCSSCGVGFFHPGYYTDMSICPDCHGEVLEVGKNDERCNKLEA